MAAPWRSPASAPARCVPPSPPSARGARASTSRSTTTCSPRSQPSSPISRARCGAPVLGLRALTFLAFYQHPTVLATLEVDWAGRAAALVARRAELLDDRPA